jgi:hypothetical protein
VREYRKHATQHSPQGECNEIKEMIQENVNDEYLRQARARGIRAGDTVLVVKGFDEEAHQKLAGRALSYAAVMNGTVGRTCEVIEVKNGNYLVRESGNSEMWWFPYYCLELVNSDIVIDGHKIKFYEDYITVGCKIIPHSKVIRIYNRITAEKTND